MANKYSLILLFFSSLTAICSIFGLPVQGQSLRVQPDGTTQTTITGGAQCSTDCTISGSNRLGNNLFHSFDTFSIPAGTTATIEDNGAINIFTRVTGESSTINGTLAITGTGNANFFLINPRGITFGPQAILVSEGSFIATTADHISFTDDVIFSAIEKTPPLLTISTPIGFQFGTSPSAIVNRARNPLSGKFNRLGAPAGLQVNAGETLTLLGSSILLDNGNLTAGSGHLQIGSVAGGSYVSLSPEFSVDYKGTSTFEDIQLVGTSTIDVSGNRGNISIQGRNISILDRSNIANLNFGSTSAGNIQLRAEGTINISGLGIFFSAVPGSTGNGSALEIITSKLVVREGALIAGGTGGQGTGGSVTINASESVEVTGTSDFAPSLITTSTDGPGTGGALIIKTQRLSVTEGAQIQAVTFGEGQGGDLMVTATDQVNVHGIGETVIGTQFASGILASSGAEGFPTQPTGEGGNLTINTKTLTIDEGAQVAVNSLGSGDSGTLEVNARNVRLDNGAQLTAAAAFGDGGNIRLENLETLVLRRGSEISTRAGTGDGQGNGGNIDIEADYIVTNLFEDSDIIAKATQGRGGNIEITTRGLYGIAERQALENNGTNDIDASSEFGISGTIAINQLLQETEQGLIALSERALETTTAVSQGCQANGNRLVVTRRGGLPTVPTDSTELETSLIDLGEGYSAPNGAAISHSNRGHRADRQASNDRSTQPVTNNGIRTSPLLKEANWVEASDWRLDERNQVVLTTQPQREHLVALQAASHCAG
ncbi:MAG: filamentous hemagglutinin N-terminal domain-containing protein [Cyanobacteria bacterium P01_F01_bin.53]